MSEGWECAMCVNVFNSVPRAIYCSDGRQMRLCRDCHAILLYEIEYERESRITEW